MTLHAEVKLTPGPRHFDGSHIKRKSGLANLEIVHRTPHRTRLRIASPARSEEFFDGLRRRLAACHGVHSVRTAHRTGTVVIWHDPAFQLYSLNFAALGLQPPLTLNGKSALLGLEGGIKKAAPAQADLGTVVLQLGLVVIAPQPLAAAAQWAAEACLKAVLRSMLTSKPKRV